MSRPLWRRWWVAGALLAALALAFVLALGECRRQAYVRVRQYKAMCAIGRAGLEYLRQKGEAPGGLDDLLGAGFLYVDESEAGMAPPGRYNTVYAEDAYQVQLSFPQTANGYHLVDGTVISRSDHRPVVLVSCDRVSTELQDYANRLFAEEWYSIMATTEGD